MKDLGKTFTRYLIAVSVPLLVGGLAAAITSGTMDVYESMVKPRYSPPAWVFPVAWTILYGLMGIASGLIFESKAPGREKSLVLYALQLLVNFLWPIVFFRWQAPLAALFVLLALLALVWWMYRQFKAIDPAAGWLIVPYLLWLLFALWLNLGIWWLNK